MNTEKYTRGRTLQTSGAADRAPACPPDTASSGGDCKKQSRSAPHKAFPANRSRFTSEDTGEKRFSPRTEPQERPANRRQNDDRATDDPDNAHSVEAQGDDELAILSGVKPVLELLEREPERIDTVLLRKGHRSKDTDRILDLCRAGKVRFTLTDAQSLERLCPAGHQGVVARLFEAGFADFSTLLEHVMDAPLPLLLVLDQVQDPGNAGTLARTLYAMGGAGLVIPRHNGAYLGAGARRAAAGALERLPVAKVMNLSRALDEAENAGFQIYGAATGEGSVDAFSTPLHTPALLVLGNEDHGIRPQVAKRCHQLIHIPMLRDFDSLNVAQAGGILVGCFARQHLEKRRNAHD